MKLLSDRVTKYGVDILINNLQEAIYNNLGFRVVLEVKPIDNFHDIDIIDTANEFICDHAIDYLGNGFIDFDVA